MPKLDIRNIESEIRTIISEIIEIDPDKIQPDASFVEDLGMDSMMALEILASIEKKYKVQIPEDKLPTITSLRKTVELAKELLSKG